MMRPNYKNQYTRTNAAYTFGIAIRKWGSQSVVFNSLTKTQAEKVRNYLNSKGYFIEEQTTMYIFSNERDVDKDYYGKLPIAKDWFKKLKHINEINEICQREEIVGY